MRQGEGETVRVELLTRAPVTSAAGGGETVRVELLPRAPPRHLCRTAAHATDAPPHGGRGEAKHVAVAQIKKAIAAAG